MGIQIRPVGELAFRQMMKHLISSKQYSREDVEDIFDLADGIESTLNMGNSKILDRFVMASLFYEPSTRTRFSFESAMLRLGGMILSTENASEFSSVIKGESLEDTIRTMGCYVDVIVLRHPEMGSAKRAAEVSTVPIINAGDGIGQHPTQALLDLYTIQKECGGIDGKEIAVVGDLLNGRTVHSLVQLLALFDFKKLYFVSPEMTKSPQWLFDYIKDSCDHNRWEEVEDLDSILPEVDVLYQTRLQRERMVGTDVLRYESIAKNYVIDRKALLKMKNDARILHPFPRVKEIDPEIDYDPRAAYFRQMRNGLYIRMAVLLVTLEPMALAMGRDIVDAVYE